MKLMLYYRALLLEYLFILNWHPLKILKFPSRSSFKKSFKDLSQYQEFFQAFYKYKYFCYKLVQSFRVTCLFIGQYNTKGYDKITAADWISFLLVGSRNYSSNNLQFGFLVLAPTIAYCSLFNIGAIILRTDTYNNSGSPS